MEQIVVIVPFAPTR